MNDPIDRLRTEGRSRAGAPFDADSVLSEIHVRTAGERPGGLTQRRRTVRASVVGVAGAGAILAGALVAPGIVPDGGAAPDVVGSPTTEVRDGIVGEDLSGDGTVVSAVAYVERARTAVEEVDLSTLVVEIASTYGVQHPGETALDTSVARQFTAGDGSATRWVSEQDFASSVGAEAVGDEETHQVDPAGPDGQMTYWWVSPRAGVYTQFTVPAENWDDIEEGTGQEQATAWIEELGSTLDEIEALAAQPDVVTSGPTPQTVGGRSATCFELAGPGEDTAAEGGSDEIDWTRTACFDDATDLPLSDTRSSHYVVQDATEPSLLVTTDEYVWHPRDDASLALLQPSLDGLREVSRDEYVGLTS